MVRGGECRRREKTVGSVRGAQGPDDRYVIEDFPFSGSFFDDIRRKGSPIRMLAGAKKFTEGWSSWRVSAMGLMNVGKKKGSEIIQLFGRGVRLKDIGSSSNGPALGCAGSPGRWRTHGASRLHRACGDAEHLRHPQRLHEGIRGIPRRGRSWRGRASRDHLSPYHSTS